jgi:hypothetical protein
MANGAIPKRGQGSAIRDGGGRKGRKNRRLLGWDFLPGTRGFRDGQEGGDDNAAEAYSSDLGHRAAHLFLIV